MLGERRSSQASATCIGVAPSPAADVVQPRRLKRAEPAQREERHVGDPVRRQCIDQRVVGAVREVILVLHADDRGDPARLRHLRCGHVADAQMADQPFLAEAGKRLERFGDRAFGRSLIAAAEHGAEVDHLDPVQPKVAQIVLDRTPQIVGRCGQVPRRVIAAQRTHLGDDHQIVG